MQSLKIKNIKEDSFLFIDIETAPICETISPETPIFKAWQDKIKNNEDYLIMGESKSFKEYASLYAEFSKIVCVSIGAYSKGVLTVKTLVDDSEHNLLEALNSTLTKAFKKDVILCGHSIKGFDIPFIYKRCLINGIPVNENLDVEGLKPWEINFLDICEIWKASSFSASSFQSMCYAFGVEYTHVENRKDIELLAQSNQKNLVALANVVRKMRFEKNAEYKILPFEYTKLGLIETISASGVITTAQQDELIQKCKCLDSDKRQKTIELLKSALIKHEKSLDFELELKILSC